MPAARDLLRCAPPHTLGAGEEPEEGGSERSSRLFQQPTRVAPLQLLDQASNRPTVATPQRESLDFLCRRDNLLAMSSITARPAGGGPILCFHFLHLGQTE